MYHVVLITPFSGVVCHPWTRTCYDQWCYLPISL